MPQLLYNWKESLYVYFITIKKKKNKPCNTEGTKQNLLDESSSDAPMYLKSLKFLTHSVYATLWESGESEQFPGCLFSEVQHMFLQVSDSTSCTLYSQQQVTIAKQRQTDRQIDLKMHHFNVAIIAFLYLYSTFIFILQIYYVGGGCLLIFILCIGLPFTF